MNNINDMTTAEFEQRLNCDMANLKAHEDNVSDSKRKAISAILAYELMMSTEEVVAEMYRKAIQSKFQREQLAKTYKDMNEALVEYKK